MTNTARKRRQLIAPWLGLQSGTRALNAGEGVIGLSLLQAAALAGGGGPTGEAATLAIFAGQSNGKGWSTDPQNTTALTNGNGYQFYPSGADGVFLPLGWTGLGRTQGGPWAAFSQGWAAAAGGTVLVVDAAVNGSSLISANKSALTGTGVSYSGGTWDLADGVNSVYNLWAKPQVTAAIAAALANGFSIQRIVVCWAQGETDGGASTVVTTQAAYGSRLLAIIDQFAADFDIDGFFISQLGTNGASPFTSGANIQAAQADAATARPTLVNVAFSGAAAFHAASKMVDTLHYTQAGYNDMGSGLASGGLAFIPAFSLAAPDPAVFTTISAAFPAITGWTRVRLTTQATSYNPSITTPAATPFTTTFVDASGNNKMRARSGALGWTFPSSAAKQICLYVSLSNGSTCQYLASSTDALTLVTIPESGVLFSRFTLSDGLLDGFAITDADIANLASSALRTLQVNKSSGRILSPQISITNASLTAQPLLTNFNVSGAGVAALNPALIPNVTTYQQSRLGLSVADVNAILVALDAGGLSSGNVNVSQFLSGAYGASVPTGAGATAKANLISKSWTATTD